MAFIRQYMNAGDPGLWRRLKRGVRKFQPGRFARGVAQFIPGPIGTVAGLVGDPYDPELAWMGDPGRGRAKNKRKAAAAGPKAKAKAKRARRGGGGLGALAGKVGGFIGSHAGELGGAAGALIGSVVPGVGTAIGGAVGGLAGEAAGELVPVGRPATGMDVAGPAMLVPHGRGRGPRVPHMATRHVDTWMVKGSRTMNPTNVKALRRSVHRIEGFERVVKAVHKAYPRMMHASSHSSRSSGGHKRGCKCFRCRRG